MKNGIKGMIVGIMVVLCFAALAPRQRRPASDDWANVLYTLDNTWLARFGYDNDAILAYQAWRHSTEIRDLRAMLQILDKRVAAIEKLSADPNTPGDPNEPQ